MEVLLATESKPSLARGSVAGDVLSAFLNDELEPLTKATHLRPIQDTKQQSYNLNIY